MTDIIFQIFGSLTLIAAFTAVLVGSLWLINVEISEWLGIDLSQKLRKTVWRRGLPDTDRPVVAVVNGERLILTLRQRRGTRTYYYEGADILTPEQVEKWFYLPEVSDGKI